MFFDDLLGRDDLRAYHLCSLPGAPGHLAALTKWFD